MPIETGVPTEMNITASQIATARLDQQRRRHERDANTRHHDRMPMSIMCSRPTNTPVAFTANGTASRMPGA